MTEQFKLNMQDLRETRNRERDEALAEYGDGYGLWWGDHGEFETWELTPELASNLCDLRDQNVRRWQVTCNQAALDMALELQLAIECLDQDYGISPNEDGFDAVLALCIDRYPTCPFGCAKDGAPNCRIHIAYRNCEPSRMIERLA